MLKHATKIIVACFLAAAGCDAGDRLPANETAPPPTAAEHAALFEQAIYEPAPGVHVAVGYALANVIMIEGDEGVIIVDTTESAAAAREVLAEFRKITEKPVAAIIYTHNHADHIFGAQVFAEGRDIPVYAHDLTNAYIDRFVNVLNPAISVRSLRMFGVALPKEARLHDGIGMELRYRPEDLALLRPTHTFDDELDIEIEGVKLTLVHAPGETPDQLYVWLPERRILLPGDNIYQAFPNLYTIRGTSYRDVTQWAASLDDMRARRPEILIPQHTLPVKGADDVEEILRAYRDAIQFVHDQTVRAMNKGMTPDEVAHHVKLPPHLAAHPWLQEVYGKVDWSARSIFAGYLGWYGGEGDALEPLSPDERARRYKEAFAAGASIEDQAAAALDAGDYAWAAELARHWMRAEPSNRTAKQTLATALEALGGAHENPNARNWYLTEARELKGDVDLKPTDPSILPDEFVAGLPIDPFMRAMAVRLKAEETLDVDFRAVFDFTDDDRQYTIHVRGGVAAIEEGAASDPDVTFTTTTDAWKRVATGKSRAALAFAGGDIKITGGVDKALKFFNWFER